MVRWIALGLIFLTAGPADAGWNAGVARVVTTPEKNLWMSGYGGRDKPAEGKVHDLWAKALVLEDPTGRRAVLLTMDLVGIPRSLSTAVCADLKAKYGLERDAILLNVSHTHCGPVVDGNLNAMYFLDAMQQKDVKDYAVGLRQKLVEVVGSALKDLAPARLSWGIGSAGFAVNRRNNKEADVPKLREAGQLKGPVDHELPVLAVYDPALKKLRAIVCGYACHATVLSFYQWCGDYPGFAQLALEKAHPGAIALFWAGCGADQNPLPRRTVALAEDYGNQLARGVEAVLQNPMILFQEEDRLRSAYTEIDLAFGDLPAREELLKAAADDSKANRFVAARARLLLKELEANGKLRGSYPYPVQVWQLGDSKANRITWVALGGEVVVDYALRLKKELGPGSIWVAGYSNDVMAYIPSLRVLKEGGYEGATAMIYYGLPCPWSPRVEEQIVGAVQEQVKKVRGGGK
jgi:hypothetical protein